MQRLILSLLVILLIPASVNAARPSAVFLGGRSLVAASPSPGNSFLAGISIINTAPIAGDLSAIGGSIVATAPVQGDELLFAGSIGSRAAVGGDVRAIGGSINMEGSISGDFLAIGYSVNSSAPTSGSTFIIALNTNLSNGTKGPLTIYGNNISLSGDYGGNVKVVAMGHLSLAPGTTIHGKLVYEAPEEATIPASASVIGGIEYTNASYLPNAGTSRILALVSIGLFLFARILGTLILAGLLAGLFPRLAETMVKRAYTARPRRVLLTLLLGFGMVTATPMLIMLLALTLVGIGLALLLLVLYALLVLLALLYAGILLGGIFARRFLGREIVFWHDGVLGMLILSLMAFIPFVGISLVLLCMLFSAGELLQIFFHFAFPHEEQTSESL
ncbi:MAG: hypothetical protein NUV60_01065 [Patescibacteria group bacterium]|nr:hypothetical protein [Patescibacteria group bacterium]